MKRTISIFLSLLLLLSVIPLTVTAVDPEMNWADLSAAFKAGGEIKLQNNISAPDGANALSVSKGKTVTLDLNGYTIDRTLDTYRKQGSVIIVSGELTVTDTSDAQTGTITGGCTDGTGGGVWIRSGRFTLEGGRISGNTAENVGGGVYLSGSGSSFTMTGGAISGNTAKNGGGFGMDNSGTVTVSGGTISGNTASNNGGGVWFGKGTSFALSGGSITDNTAAARGGGIYINDGSFDYSGGSVTGNHQSVGGDIAAKSGSYLPTFDITVSSSGSGTVTADKETAAEGETVTLTVVPDSNDYYGYKLKTLTVTSGDDVIPTETISEDTYTFSMPAAAVAVSAEFRELHEINTYVELYNDPYTPHGCTLTADKDYAIEGETVTLTMDLKPGYEYMTGDVNYTLPITQVDDTTFTFVMPDDDAEAAVYLQKAEFSVSLGGTASSGVLFLLNDEPRDIAPFPAEYNDMITVIFYPEDRLISGMTYTYTENGETVTNSINYDWNDMGALEGAFRMPNGDVTVRVEYNEIYNVTEDWAHVENGIILADVTKAAEGSSVTVYAAPDQRYAFSGWSFTPDVTVTSDMTETDGTRVATFVMPAADVSFYATFAQTIYNVNAELPDGHGTISAETRGYGGEPFSFTVTPDDGYAIKSVKAVSGGTELSLTQSGSTYSFEMPYADVTLTAEFENGSTWSDLVTLMGAGGTITLQRDYTAVAFDAGLEVPEDVSVVLDLNGHTINGDALIVPDVIVVNGTLTLADSGTGGQITGCNGDDVVYLQNGDFEMTGGTLYGIGHFYSCVYVENGCTFRLVGGTVNGFDGFGAVSNFGTFDLRGGTVTGDTEDIISNESADMLMSGGSIRGSIGSAEEYGFGIYLEDSDLYLSGSVDIDVTERPETLEGEPDNFDAADFDIGVNMGSMIYVTGALDLQGPQVGVRKMHGVFARGGAYASGEEDYVLTQSDVDCFKSTHPAYGVRLISGNQAELAYVYSVNIADDIENGTVSASASTAFDGDYVELTLEPAEGYVVESVTVNGYAIQPDADNQYGFYMQDEDVTVSAVFTVYVDPDEAAADAVEAKIDAIGEVAYTAESKAKIDEARIAYDALTEAQQALVENYGTLTAAETTYAALKAAADQVAADQAAADAVIAKIDAIGEVAYTDDCKAKIDDAKDAYDALTDAQKALVTNAQTLTDAINRYNDLEAAAQQAAADRAAADAVIAKINAIGEVAYTNACKAKIDAARAAYNALTAAQKALVTNYETLTAAEARYAELKAAAQQAADQAAADAVIAKIDAIGEVTYTDESKAKIDDARAAYNRLTGAQKALVTNYAKLTAAEARYAELTEIPCKYCGEIHDTSIGGGILAIWHAILYFFAHLFGLR